MASGQTTADQLPDCESFPSDVVRYLKCIGIEKNLEQNYSVHAAFKEEWGKARLFLIGSEQARISSRADIQAKQRVSKSFLIPALALSRLRKSYYPDSEVMLQMSKREINVGWYTDLKAEKLTICCANEDDINEALSILLEHAGIPHTEIKEMNMSADLTGGRSPADFASTAPLSPLNPIMKPINQAQDTLADDALPPSLASRSSLPIENHSLVVDNVDTTPIDVANVSDIQLPPDQEQQHTEKIYLTLDQIRFMFFNAKKMNFVQMTNETFGVEVIFDKAQCFIEFRGGVDSVSRALADFQALLENLTTKSIAKPKEFMACLTRDVKPSEVKASLKQAQARVGWDIREGLLWLCGDNDTSVMRAQSAICGLITTGEFPEAECLTEAQKKSLSSVDRWKQFEDQVLKEHPTIRLAPATDFSKITFTLRKNDSADLVTRTLTAFFQSIKFHEFRLPINENFSKLLGIFKEYVRNECSPEDEQVALNVTESLCTISSLSERSVEHATKKLLEIQGKIVAKYIDVKSKAELEWLQSEEGINRMVEILHKTTTFFTYYVEDEDCLLSNRIKVLMGDIADTVLKVGELV